MANLRESPSGLVPLVRRDTLVRARLCMRIGSCVGFHEWLSTRQFSERRKQVLCWFIVVFIIIEQTHHTLPSYDKQEFIYGPAHEASQLLLGADVGYIRYDG